MTISAITIENFKGIKDPITIEMKPITLLFGPNSAGKSTIVQALHYAREIFDRQNLNPDKTMFGGDSIDLGGFESLVSGHDLSLPVTLRLHLDLTYEDLPTHEEDRYIENRDSPGNVGLKLSEVPAKIIIMEVAVTIRWSEQLAKPFIELYRVYANGHYLFTIRATADGKDLRFDINPYNPIFLPEDVTPQEAEDALFKIFEAEDDEPQFKVGVLCWAWQELTESFDGSGIYSFDIAGGLESALPKKHKTITFNFPERDFPIWDSKNEKEQLRVAKEKASFAEFTHNLSLFLDNIIAGPCAAIRENLKNFCYVGPLREVPARGHKPVVSPDASRWANGLAAYDTLFSSSEVFIDQVNDWLTGDNRLDSGYSVEMKKYRELKNDHPLVLAMLQGRILDEDMDLREQLLALPVLRRLLIRDEARDIELEPQDIGVGISQVLPVVVAALHNKTGLVVIEQPELHIHPAFQVALGDLFIEQVKENSGLFFLLETHSEHLLLRFLRRIRENFESGGSAGMSEFSEKEISIYYIETANEQVKVSELKVSEDGDSANKWPTGFFEERHQELF